MESASLLSKFFWDRLGLAWAFYFLWMKQVPEAFVVSVLFWVMGTATAWMMERNVFTSKKVDRYFLQIWPVRRMMARWFGYLTAGYFLYEQWLP